MEVACSAHARRKFFEARSNAPREANEILEWIRQLYDVEDRRGPHAGAASGAAPAGVGAILDGIETKLEDLGDRLLPESAMGKR